jgi:site-specific recombinase XerD
MEAEGKISDENVVLIEKACEDFLADARARGLRESSIYKYRLLLTQLQAFTKDKGIVFISAFGMETTSKFRETWTNKGTAAAKKLEALRTFMKFCHDRRWVEENYAKKLGMPKNTEPPVEPFTREQFAAIVKAIGKYPDKPNAVRLLALVLVLRYSGLRLGDAVTLNIANIEDERLFLRTEKTGTRVRVPLPKEAVNALARCPRPFPFWSGQSKRKSVGRELATSLEATVQTGWCSTRACPQIPAYVRC